MNGAFGRSSAVGRPGSRSRGEAEATCRANGVFLASFAAGAETNYGPTGNGSRCRAETGGAFGRCSGTPGECSRTHREWQFLSDRNGRSLRAKPAKVGQARSYPPGEGAMARLDRAEPSGDVRKSQAMTLLLIGADARLRREADWAAAKPSCDGAGYRSLRAMASHSRARRRDCETGSGTLERGVRATGQVATSDSFGCGRDIGPSVEEETRT